MSFFADVPKAPPDPLLSISGRYKADTRTPKFDLGLGVLRKTDNTDFVFETVLEGGKRNAPACYYTHPGGNDEFVRLTGELVFGGAKPDRVMGVQTVGGSGALRCTEYTYFDEATHTVNIQAMLNDIKNAPQRSAIMFQVAAHNPTGIDVTDEQWDQVLELMKERKDLFPVFDSAYQGLARGLVEDMYVVRKFNDAGMEFAVCNSCSKNFGLYGERAGTLFVACQSAEIAECVASRCKLKIRTNYSVPPQHGSKIVVTVLSDPELRKKWESELNGVREALGRSHAAFAKALKDGGMPAKYSAPRFGLFTQLFLSGDQVEALEKEQACYVAPGGRVNVSPLTEEAAAEVAKRISIVLAK